MADDVIRNNTSVTLWRNSFLQVVKGLLLLGGWGYGKSYHTPFINRILGTYFGNREILSRMT